MGMGLMEGSFVEIVSRLDPNLVWTGMVTLVDYENAEQNSYDSMYYGNTGMNSTSNYPFYVTLDSTEGLLLGQHVYIRLARVNELAPARVLMPENYLMGVRYNEETLITSADVWCVGEEGKLTKREVVLGEYVMDQGCYVVLEGLTLEDYVADPTNPDCAEGVMTDVRSEEDFGTADPESAPTQPSAEGETAAGEDEGSFAPADTTSVPTEENPKEQDAPGEPQ
jgi:HlyD family secretion protein